MSDLPELDPAALQRLQRLGGDAFVSKMIDLFVEFGGAKVAEARTAFGSGNLKGLEKAVHPVKSSAGNIGAVRVQDLALKLEKLAQQAEVEPLPTLLDELEQAFATAARELSDRKLQLKTLPVTPAVPQADQKPTTYDSHD